jgi:hypothetical protein
LATTTTACPTTTTWPAAHAPRLRQTVSVQSCVCVYVCVLRHFLSSTSQALTQHPCAALSPLSPPPLHSTPTHLFSRLHRSFHNERRIPCNRHEMCCLGAMCHSTNYSSDHTRCVWSSHPAHRPGLRSLARLWQARLTDTCLGSHTAPSALRCPTHHCR